MQKRFSRVSLLSTGLSTFAFVLLILFCALGARHNHSYINANAIGMYVICVFLLLVGMGLSTYVYFRHKYDDNLFNIFLFIPFVGFCAMVYLYFCWFRSPHREKNKPLPIVAILLFVTIFVVGVIWVIYAINGKVYINSKGQPGTPGIFDILLSPINGFISAADIIIYLFIMGAFIHVMHKSRALDAGIGRVVKKMKGKEMFLIPIILLLFAICGTTFGMCEECIAFYAIIMPVILAAGFDAVVGFVVILFGAALGVCASIINPFMILTSVNATKEYYADQSWISNFSIYDGLLFRFFVFVVFYCIVTGFIMVYAKKVKKNNQKSIVYEMMSEHKKVFCFTDTVIPELTTKRKIALIIFLLAFIFLILGAIPWDVITKSKVFENADTWLRNHFPFLSIGAGAIGTWQITTFALLFLTGTFIVGAMNWEGSNKFYGDLTEGAKGFFNVVVVLALARGLGIILQDSGLSESLSNKILAPVLKVNETLGLIVMYFIFFILSILLPSTSGFAYTIFGPIAAPAIVNATASFHGHKYSLATGIASVSITNGLVNLCSPTAGPFLVGADLTKIPLTKFYKFAWKMLLAMFVAGLVLVILSQFFPAVIQGDRYWPGKQ